MRKISPTALAILATAIVTPGPTVSAQRPATDTAADTGVATTPGAFDFSIKNIMRGPELYGRPPVDVRWSADNRWIYFNWVEPGKDWRERPAPYRVRAVPAARPERLSLIQRDSAAPYTAQGSLSPDRRRAAVEAGGDIYVVDYRDG
ncbi:MAG: hypothetical protein ACR2GG_06785, partial [Gemmatimonadaceae bacterium]